MANELPTISVMQSLLILAARCALLLCVVFRAESVLRYPDGSFESRFPLHLDECGSSPLTVESTGCLKQLRGHLLDDADCNRVICDNIATSTPVEVYANRSDWLPFKNLCGNLNEVFAKLFDMGLELTRRPPSFGDAEQLMRELQVFANSAAIWGVREDESISVPAYANTTRSAVLQHGAKALEIIQSLAQATAISADMLLQVAVEIARRVQLLIENFSLNLLINFHVAQLEQGGRLEHRTNLIHNIYGNVDELRVKFHEIPGKRWDSLRYLLDFLGVAERKVTMAEIGVEAANTSSRLLDTHEHLAYVGVDPYVRNDGLYNDVVQRLGPHLRSGRFLLYREKSLDAVTLIDDGSLDIVFLDARHDYEAVEDDISAWRPKVRKGGIVSGHDFSWMFPTVAMAVYAIAPSVHDKTINVAPDGVWWVYL